MNARIEPEALLAMLYIQYNTENIKNLSMHHPLCILIHITKFNPNSDQAAINNCIRILPCVPVEGELLIPIHL